MQAVGVLNHSFINGEWTEGTSARAYDILNPYDNSVITSVRLASKEQLDEAFQIAKEAQKQWAKSTVEERRAVLHKAMDYLNKNREEIVRTIGLETGGTVLKANIEFHLTIELLEESIKFADEIGKVREVPGPDEAKLNHIHRLPLGVIASISPFNFPMNLSMRTIAPAIALGNCVVHKPDIKLPSLVVRSLQKRLNMLVYLMVY